MDADYLDHLPDSECFGVLNAFTFDDDDYNDYDEEYEIEDEVWSLQDKYIEKHFSCEEKMLHYGYHKDGKWIQKINKALEALEENPTGRFWKKAKRIVAAKKKKEKAEAHLKTLARIKKSKYKVLVATTNHASQRKAEAFLKKLGFKLELRFTNPNHGREDQLNLWLLKQ